VLSKSYRILLLPLAALLLAQAPIPDSGRLVRNIDDESGYQGLVNFGSLSEAGDRAFFLLDNSRAGLWTTNGAATSGAATSGTGGDLLFLGKFEGWDLAADRGRSVATETGLLFRNRFGELYHSDGTVAGTQRLFSAAKRSDRPQSRSGFVPVGSGRWVFSASGGPEGSGELWVTDGTEAGSHFVTKLQDYVPSSPEEDTHSRLGMKGLFFGFAEDSTNFGDPSDLWITDGTADGTRILATIPSGFPSFLQGVHEDRSVFIIGRHQQASVDLWSTDGTEEGTESFTLTALGGAPFYFSASARLGTGWVFLVRPDGAVEESTCDLWFTDGSETGTQPVVNLNELIEVPPGGEIPYWNCPSNLVSTGDRVFFSFNDPVDGTELWVSDGTRNGTRKISDLAPDGERSSVRALMAWNGGVAFRGEGPSGPATLYFSDGTLEGTRPISDRGHIGSIQRMADELWFSVHFSSPQRVELWATRGTAASERRIAELAVAEDSSNPGEFLPFSDRLFFVTGDSFSRGELWSTDGTSAGTNNLDLSALRSFPIDPEMLRVVGDELYIVDHSSIFATDGTVEGSREVVPWQHYSFDRPEFAKLGSRLLFSGNGEEGGTELWIRDDAAEAPELFLDLNPGRTPDPEYPGEFYENSSYPTHLTHWKDQVVFSAFNEEMGTQLWLTDGSREGTRVVRAASDPMAETGFVSRILPIRDRIFFHRLSSGLWVSDGTSGGTRPVLTAAGEQLSGRDYAEFRGRCLVVAPSRESGGKAELWLTDGTAEGTLRIAEVPAAVNYEHQLAVTGGQGFLLLTSEEAGSELWVTDGTATGTRLVKDIAPGSDSPSLNNLRAVDGIVLFAAEHPLLGSEPWVSDGTEEGTHVIADIRPEKEGSAPAGFTAFKDEIYFSAFRNDVGRELFAIDRDLIDNRCTPSSRRLCLQEGRFTVEVDWRDQRRGSFGVGTASGHSEDTGFFWFFREENVELVVKMLDGRDRNEHFWYFSGALSDVEYWITVTDHENGRTQTFHNPPGNLCGRGETAIFREGDVPITESESRNLNADLKGKPVREGIESAQSGATCSASPNALLLQDGRFAVEVDWETARQGGRSGVGTPVPGTDASGYFWFFNPDNLELVLKILDGRETTGQFWVLYGALSDVGYEIRVTDLETCTSRVYNNSEGNVCGRADIQAF